MPQFAGRDRRVAPAGRSYLPATALEQGLWECDIGGGAWVPYPWPIGSVIEQAYCRFKPEVAFSQRGMDYKVHFSHETEEYVAASQVNCRTSMRREVRRWPSLRHKGALEERGRQEAQRAWGTWLQADWGWVLFDAQDGVPDSGCQGASLPRAPQPAAEVYSLGACTDGLCFPEPHWPELLRHWPCRALKCAAHPLGRRCNFALQRFSDGESTTLAPAREWASLQEAWRQGGLGGKGKLVAAYRVMNRGLLHGFHSLREAMLGKLGADSFKDGQSREGQLAVRMLWHGTKSASALLEICSDGFDRAMATTCAWGKGCYFATHAGLSDKYGCDVKVPCEPHRKLRALVLAAVLVGETAQGSSGLYPPPVKPHSRTGERYENTCDRVGSPTIIVTYKDSQALPCYVMVYQV